MRHGRAERLSPRCAANPQKPESRRRGAFVRDTVPEGRLFAHPTLTSHRDCQRRLLLQAGTLVLAGTSSKIAPTCPHRTAGPTFSTRAGSTRSASAQSATALNARSTATDLTPPRARRGVGHRPKPPRSTATRCRGRIDPHCRNNCASGSTAPLLRDQAGRCVH